MMRRIAQVCLILAVLLPSLTSGSEWSVKGFVDQNLSYDDNVCMRPDEQLVDRQCQSRLPSRSGSQGFQTRRGSFKYMIIPVITFQHKTDVSDVAASASYGTQLYSDMVGFDQDIQNYDIRSSFRTEKFVWGLGADYSITPSRNSASINSGVYSNNSNQNTWRISPSATYKIDEINNLVLTPTYSETSYTQSANGQGSQAGGFSNNRAFNIDLAWNRLWNTRYLTGLSFFYSTFESQVPLVTRQGTRSDPTTFDTFGINFSNTYTLSDHWTLVGVIGGRYTESKYLNNNHNSFGFLADASVNYAGENFAARLHFNRSLIPSSLGLLQEQTSISFNSSYKIRERLSTNFTTNYTETTSVSSSNGNANNQGTRKYLVIEPSVTWQLARDWSLGGSYRYRLQDGQIGGISGISGITTGEADSNLFMLSIKYNWQGISVSR